MYANGLTEREFDILIEMKDGQSRADIASFLRVKPATVSVHIFNAKAKLGLKTQRELFLWLEKWSPHADK